MLPPDGEPTPFFVTEAAEAQPSFSPDGRWIAYSSNRSDRYEIYVKPYPGEGAETQEGMQVSTAGGQEPIWSQAGDAIFYRFGDALYRVTVTTEPRLDFGAPRIVLRGAYSLSAGGDLHYSATPDRDRFLMVTEHSATRIRVILNWFDDIEDRLDGAP